MSADDEEPLTLTVFPSDRDAQGGKRETFTRETLAGAMLSPDTPRGTPKKQLRLVSMATFKGNHRKNENVESVRMLGLDIDDPTCSPASTVLRIALALGGVEVFAYSTSSSKPDEYKLRVLIPYDAPATGEQHRLSWRLVHRILERDAGVKLDRSCCDPARGFYIWAVPENGVYKPFHYEGLPWPVAKAAAKAKRWQEAEDAARRARDRELAARRKPSSVSAFERARRWVAKAEPSVSGSRGHDALWNVARKIVADFGLPREDAMSILHEFNARCEPPWTVRELEHKLDGAEKAHTTKRMDP